MCSKAAIELLAMWAVVPSCWEVFSHYLHYKKRAQGSLQDTFLNVMYQKEYGSNYSKNLDNLDWVKRSPGLAKHKTALKNKPYKWKI
jgi:hypothetical protein